MKIKLGKYSWEKEIDGKTVKRFEFIENND